METRILCLLGILLFTTAPIHATSYTSIAPGDWDNPAIWSPNGVPENDDEVIIDHAVILTEDMIQWSHGLSLLTINSAGSLVSAGDEGIQIDNDGFFTVSGTMNVYEVYFKGSAEVIINAGAEVIVQTDWTTQGENAGDLDPFIVNGSITILGTFEDDGSVITGTGTITAGEWDLEGTFLFYGQYDPNNPPDPNQTLYGSTWEGDVSADWNIGANWFSQETPGTTDVVYIPSELSTYPVIANGISGQCDQIILESGGTVTIQPGGSLTVTSEISNAGTFLINSDMTGTGSLIDGGVVSGPGTFQVQRFLTDQSGFNSYFVHQVCAPVSGQPLEAFNLIPGRTYAYEFIPATNSWNNIWDPNMPIPSMKGIILSTLNNTGDQVAVFTGQVITGTQSVTVTPASAPGETALNLIGNPYLSPVDWEQIASQPGIQDYLYIWDPSVPEYKSYVKGTGGSNSCRYIQVGQAFFVGTDHSASSLTFENSDRTHQSAPYLKEEATDYLEVSLSGGNGTGSTGYVRLRDDASVAFDKGKEAEKWFSIYGDEANEIYFMSSDGIATQVAAFPKADAQPVSVSLNFHAAIIGQYSLNFGGTESFSPGIKIFLEDRLNPAQGWYNLTYNPEYQFIATPSEPKDRFVIHIGRDITAIDETTGIAPDPVFFSAEVDAICIHNPSGTIIESISVYDISGREILEQGRSTGNLVRIALEARNCFCIIKVTTGKGITTGKVFLR